MTTSEQSAQPTFADLGLDEALVGVLRELGYETPTPIQAQAIDPLLAGRDVVGLAQTGTGKTAAFALPILQSIDIDRSETQALVLAPTRELALQVSDAMTRYASRLPGLRILPIYGGQGYAAQLRGLQRGAHVVVGTPGRVIDHLDRGSLELSGLAHLVLDEADEMLTMGFAEAVERILADTPDDKQVALFSATMPPPIRRLAKQYLTDPVDVATPAATQSTTTVRQRWVSVPHHGKFDALTRLLEVEDGDAMIIFVRTKQATEELAERLRSRGFDAAALNGDLVQSQRERIVGQLKSGTLDILVATDVAARGLDVERITHVINHDVPHDTESYVHRIGRTGRAGRSGDAILFVTPRERRMLSAIEKVSGRPVEEMSVPSADEVNSQRAERFAGAITDSLGSAQFHAFRALVEEYATNHDVSMTDVAAALAVMTSADKEFFLRPDPPKSERPPRAERPARAARPFENEGAEAPDGWRRYRLAVGKRHKIGPAAVVGALANEGGLKRSDFGKITIGGEHTIVELPADLPDAVFDALSGTRISGRLIDIQVDQGPPPSRQRGAAGRGRPSGRGPGTPPRQASKGRGDRDVKGDTSRKPRHR